MHTLESLAARLVALEEQAARDLAASSRAEDLYLAASSCGVDLLKSAGFSSPPPSDEDGLSATPETPSPGPTPLCPACGASASICADSTETTAVMKRLSALETVVLALQSSRYMPTEYARREPAPAVGWMQSLSGAQRSPERVPERGSDPVVCSTGSMPIRG